MLGGKLYTLIENSVLDQKITARIALNKDHEIFCGHFPEIPILPGVCTIQIISELLSEHLKTKLRFTEGDTIKFTGLVNPNTDPQLNIEITILKREGNTVSVSCQVLTQTATVFKMKGTFSC